MSAALVRALFLYYRPVARLGPRHVTLRVAPRGLTLSNFALARPSGTCFLMLDGQRERWSESFRI